MTSAIFGNRITPAPTTHHDPRHLTHGGGAETAKKIAFIVGGILLAYYVLPTLIFGTLKVIVLVGAAAGLYILFSRIQKVANDPQYGSFESKIMAVLNSSIK